MSQLIDVATDDRSAVDSPPEASYLRVVLSGVAAMSAVPIVGFLSAWLTGGWEVHGFVSFFFIGGLFFLGGAAVVRVSRVNSVLLGLLFGLPMAIGALMRQSPLGVLISLALGLGAGALGIRHDSRLELPRHGNLIFFVIAALLLPASLFDWPRGPEDAVRSVYDSPILGSFQEGDNKWFAVPISSYHEDGGQDLALIRVVKKGWRWNLADAESLRERPIDFPSSAVEVSMAFRTIPSDQPVLFSEGCAVPNIFAVPAHEVIHNCWLPTESFLVEIAPRLARRVEIYSVAGGIEARSVQPPSEADPEGTMRYREGQGQIFPTLSSNAEGLKPSQEPVRFAYMDSEGSLISARPSIRLAFTWYQQVGRLINAPFCDRSSYGGLRCDSDARQHEFTKIYRIEASLSLLLPTEYRVLCGERPPPGEWVLVADVGLDPDRGIGLVWDQEDPDADPSTFREVVLGVTPTEEKPATWIDESTLTVRQGRACYRSALR